jgi:hypothetical protein
LLSIRLYTPNSHVMCAIVRTLMRDMIKIARLLKKEPELSTYNAPCTEVTLMDVAGLDASDVRVFRLCVSKVRQPISLNHIPPSEHDTRRPRRAKSSATGLPFRTRRYVQLAEHRHINKALLDDI